MKFSLLLAPALLAAPPAPSPWDMTALSAPPSTVPSEEAKVEGHEALYIDGLPFKGKPTRFFAYLGVPKSDAGKLPAVVLVHGGGATALSEWVKYWNAKGYVAIAMDNEGQIPVSSGNQSASQKGERRGGRWQTIESLNHPWGGPPQRQGSFNDFRLPVEDQWMTHAVGSAIRCVSLLSARPEVDPKRIGIVGISWGSVICSTAGGVDTRLAFVVSQYIGGNLQLGNVWYEFMRKNPETFRWNPSNFYPNPGSHAQWLWINGVNDKYGLPTMTTKSWHDTQPNSWMTLLPTQGHGMVWGENGGNALREIYAFADSVVKAAPPLPRILLCKLADNKIVLRWKSETPVTKAQLVWTPLPIPTTTLAGEVRKDWEKVKYQTTSIPLPAVTAQVDGSAEASFEIDPAFRAGFINLLDERGLTVSGDFLDASK